MTPVIRAYDAVVDSVNKDERSLVARINTAGVDRYNTVIDPRGGSFRNWQATGMPILWEHGKDPRRFTDPVANAARIWKGGHVSRSGVGKMPTEILMTPKFLDDDFSRQRFDWCERGVIKGWSVNILPRSGTASPPTREELRSFPEWEGADAVYREWDLAEVSLTVVAGNADALTLNRTGQILELVQRGLLWLPDEARSLLDQAIARYITHSDGKWTVHAEDGKHMGTYDSKEAAEKRLREIEYFKHHDRGMSDSGGMATGGAAVKPHRVKKRGEKYVVEDEEGNELSEHDDPGEAQERLGMPAPKRSAPASAEPRIECDGQVWSLWVGETRILDAPDAETVERAAAALSTSRTLKDLHSEFMAEQTLLQERAIVDLREKLALKLEGKV